MFYSFYDEFGYPGNLTYCEHKDAYITSIAKCKKCYEEHQQREFEEAEKVRKERWLHELGRCKKCGTGIYWMKTKNGKSIPVQPEDKIMEDLENLVKEYDPNRHTCHFNVCDQIFEEKKKIHAEREAKEKEERERKAREEFLELEKKYLRLKEKYDTK